MSLQTRKHTHTHTHTHKISPWGPSTHSLSTYPLPQRFCLRIPLDQSIAYRYVGPSGSRNFNLLLKVPGNLVVHGDYTRMIFPYSLQLTPQKHLPQPKSPGSLSLLPEDKAETQWTMTSLDRAWNLTLGFWPNCNMIRILHKTITKLTCEP